MITDRHKNAFVAIYFGLALWLGGGGFGCVTMVQATQQLTAAEYADAATLPMASVVVTHAQQNEVNAALTDVAATARAASVTTNPRVDYNNEWRPLGHGDPLKNDPTYDYSPPTLDRVRYWAENNSNNNNNGGEKDVQQKKQQLPQDVLKNKSQSEILLLGVSSERQRGQPPPSQKAHYAHIMGEAPLLQPKYTTIRRSYYAQQQQHMPPTHLMPPPPMQQMIQQQQQMLKHMTSAEYNRPHVALMSSSHHMASTSTTSNNAMHGKPLYHSHQTPSAAGTATWMPSSKTPSRMSSMYAHEPPHAQSASMQHYSFTRPLGTTQSVAYSPNAIHAPQKPLQRKPWLHELLQKELIIKPSVRPTMPATKYLMGTTQPVQKGMMHGVGISTTFKPVTYVSAPPTIMPTVPLTTQTTTAGYDIYITPTPAPAPVHAYRPIYSTTPSSSSTTTTTTTIKMASSTTPITTPSTTSLSNRLLIPTMSNLAQRPTVAPIELTTDSLFKHYKQPQQPLMGPMYLIIEGHSKVKTYGQNELDPHQPKIVPIIPKREPIIRVADPNEKRGTVETYQVKHLHTKTTPTWPATTTTTTTTTAAPPKSSTTTTTTTTTAPMKPTAAKLIATTRPPTTTTTTTKLPTTTTTPATAKPTTLTETAAFAGPTPPTGMQGLLSLLNIFTSAAEGEDTADPIPLKAPLPTKSSTLLKPVTQPEPRIGTNADSIRSDADEDIEYETLDDRSEFVNTELPPRGLRQVFDYDELPESRLKQLNMGIDDDDEQQETAATATHYGNDDYDDDDDAAVEEHEVTQAAGNKNVKNNHHHDENDDDNDDDEDDDETHKLLKRIDKFVDAVDDDDDDDDDVTNAAADLDVDDNDNEKEDDDDDDDNNDEDASGQIYESLVNSDSDEDLAAAVGLQRKQQA